MTIVEALAFANSQLTPCPGTPSDVVFTTPPTYGSMNDFTSSQDPGRIARAGPPFVIPDVGCGLEPLLVVVVPLRRRQQR